MLILWGGSKLDLNHSNDLTLQFVAVADVYELLDVLWTGNIRGVGVGGIRQPFQEQK